MKVLIREVVEKDIPIIKNLDGVIIGITPNNHIVKVEQGVAIPMTIQEKSETMINVWREGNRVQFSALEIEGMLLDNLIKRPRARKSETVMLTL